MKDGSGSMGCLPVRGLMRKMERYRIFQRGVEKVRERLQRVETARERMMRREERRLWMKRWVKMLENLN